jgi:hypothetical protein
LALRQNGVLQNEVSGMAPASGRSGFPLDGTALQRRDVTIAPAG